MAHEVESMFSVKELPWHGLGVIIDQAPSIEEAIKVAGLDWKVKLETLSRADGVAVTHKAVVRESDKKTLGVVGPKWRPLQNKDLFEFFRPFVDAKEAVLETAGSLRGGKTVWALARLNRAPIEIKAGDVIQKYLMLSNGHDGTISIRPTFTPIRVVCANTLAMAEEAKANQYIRIFHGKNAKENLEAVRQSINAADAAFEMTAKQYKKLAAKGVKEADLKEYVRLVFDLEEQAEDERKKLANEKLEERIVELFEKGRGNDLAGVRGTYWALYNGVTEYLSYESGRSIEDKTMERDRRMNSLWFGEARAKNTRAFSYALQMAGGAA